MLIDLINFVAKTDADRDTGGSRGLGFIPYSAIQALDGLVSIDIIFWLLPTD